MKNVMYLILVITLFSASCCKKDDGNVTPVTKTPGQLHPEYLGKWHCDSVHANGSLNDFSGNNYEFQDIKCIITDDTNLLYMYIFDNWEISGTTLILNLVYIYSDTLTIVSPPANNKMVLLDYGYTEFLSKQ